MLTHWKIRNFKSIADPTDLALKPLTLLTGVNSAGKSSLIQSILLVAQTLQDEDAAVELTPNGELVNLGSVDDIWNLSNTRELLNLGFTLDTGPDESNGLLNSISMELAYKRLRNKFAEMPEKLITASMWLNRAEPGTGKDDQNFAPDFQFGTERTNDRPENRGRCVVEHVSETVNQEWRDYLLSQHVTRSHWHNYLLKDCDVTRRHFLPHRIIAPLSAGQLTRARLLLKYTEPLRASADPIQLERFAMFPQEESIPEDLQSLLVSELRQKFRRVGGQPPNTYREYLMLVNGLSETERASLLFKIEARLLEDVTPSRREHIADSDRLLLPLPPLLGQAVQQIYNFFVRRILYIGAVRVEPVLVMNLTSSAPWGKYVGLHGEKLPYAIGRYSNLRRQYPRPEKPSDEKIELSRALEEWLHYLGLADGVGANTMGRWGYQVRVVDEHNGKNLVDLGSVGLGVSQALPILVNGLLMEPGSLLLIEQPEVHLHPRAQSRLGDFLLALARSGRQVIVETHSDHLTNRIIRRIAEDLTDKTRDQTQIYFASRQNGTSQYDPVKIDEMGMVQNWPEGFMDEYALEAMATINAQLRRADQNEGAFSAGTILGGEMTTKIYLHFNMITELHDAPTLVEINRVVALMMEWKKMQHGSELQMVVPHTSWMLCKKIAAPYCEKADIPTLKKRARCYPNPTQITLFLEYFQMVFKAYQRGQMIGDFSKVAIDPSCVSNRTAAFPFT